MGRIQPNPSRFRNGRCHAENDMSRVPGLNAAGSPRPLPRPDLAAVETLGNVPVPALHSTSSMIASGTLSIFLPPSAPSTLLLVSLSGIKPNRPDFAALHQSSSPPTGSSFIQARWSSLGGACDCIAPATQAPRPGETSVRLLRSLGETRLLNE